MTDRIDYKNNAYEAFPKLAESQMQPRKPEFTPNREVVRFYEIPDNLRDWKELTKNMTVNQLLELQEFVQKSIVKKLGS